ncbi:MAG: shikimate kinase [Xanthomonadales bacterium]|nr:shikimate kinase [Xanthomonadales bacterium]
MHDSEQNIILVGPMGSGKTTIGRVVAREFGLQFYDCDHELERQTGASVNLIFDVEGEAGFRERETALLRRLLRKKGVLVATGGGVITREANRKLLRGSGLIVWLRTTVDQQLKRLSHDKSRPLLQAPDRRARLETLARERDPQYRRVADIEFASPDRHYKLAAKALIQQIRSHADGEASGTAHAQG